MEDLDLRIQKTYKSLVEAIEILLKEKEFEKISVTEICDLAMIRRPTFYKHFLDKYDFLTFFIKSKMNVIFDYAFQNLNEEESNFFILVFEQLLQQPDNVLHLIFSIQLNSDVMLEMVSVQEYGQNMLKNFVNLEENVSTNHVIKNEYKRQIIMGVTIQSVDWYKNNKEKIHIEEMLKLYEKTLENLMV
ncbi:MULTISPECIES: transcriptional regulator [Alkalibacterium]|uniref:HTH tetR-type domain-containing protein n=2 Tax=Alkalibacterium TaxID=99906 RepID=A0A2T0W7I4_9LACT|nr:MULTISPECIES: transcriptional regulator [Alkalibacterium]PRY82645.1 hypothetical protein CLV38_110107 [Alkalibacterium olivapovliticus]SDK92788.1 transcriptional regulator, TetR family [Alkalibacterium thalassium]